MEIAETIRRLEMIKTALAEIPNPEQFNLSSWARHEGTEERPHLAADNKAIGCGTVVCAMGYCGLRPEFNALGFELYAGAPFHQGSSGFIAVDRFLGLWDDATYDELDDRLLVALDLTRNSSISGWLFQSDNYENGSATMPAEVIERLDLVIAAARALPEGG